MEQQTAGHLSPDLDSVCAGDGIPFFTKRVYRDIYSSGVSGRRKVGHQTR